MNRARVMALLLAATTAGATVAGGMPLPVYADEIETSVDIDENSAAQTSSDSDDDEAEDGEDTVYQNGSINTKDTSSYETIEIKTVDDLRTLADNCHSDAWSQNKRVTLEADIVLSGDDATLEIPTFGGIFQGNGHTISGLIVNDDEADRGLFGTIQESGLVQNMTVTGSLTPTGTQSRLGGIAGTNYGQIVDCTFQGTITADAEIGGIVGRNKLSGVVSGCSSRGTITGNSYTGGIVGYNEGEIRDCSSRTDVNIDYTDTTVTTDQLTNTLTNIFQNGTLNSTENIQARTDTGGIAGFSSGIVYACRNNGSVGYEHVGYNTGGVVGRSSGMVNACTNYGKVQGRKDVGGIAGQLTPNLRLDFEESTLDEISDKLDELDSMVDNTLDSTQSYSNDTSERLSRISDLTSSAKDSTKIITDNAQNRVDEAVPKINNATSTAQSAMRTLSDVTGTVSNYADDVVDSLDSLDDSVGDLLDDLNLTDSEKSRIKSILSSMNEDVTAIRKDLKEITGIVTQGSDAIKKNSDLIEDDIADIIYHSNQLYQSAEALDEVMSEAAGDQWENSETKDLVDDLIDDTKLIADTMDTIKEYIYRIQNNDTSLGGEVADILGDWTDGVGDEDYEAIADKANAVADNIQQYLDQMKAQNPDAEQTEQYQGLYKIMVNLREGGDGIDDNLNQIESLLGKNEDVTDQTLEQLLKKLNSLQKNNDDILGQVQSSGKLLGDLANHYGNLDWDDLSSSMDDLGDVLNNAPEISGKIQSALNSLASLDLHVDGVSDATRTAGDDLYSSMSSLLDEMDALNTTVNGDMNSTYDDIRAISTQINDIADLFNDAVNGITDDADDDHIEDVSAEDIDGSTRGRLTGCLNSGTVEADNNVGGIAGTMGLEYDLDPEKDIQKFGDTSLDYAYRVKCIIDRSENQGKVEIANNYGGGIVGHMEMGVVSQSADYGKVESDGRYTGGISGYSVGTIQHCYAKADLSGDKYVGGIAGYAETLYDNAAMVNIIDSEQFLGAIAGKVKELDKTEVAGNIYVSSEIYGIDGISYQGIAEGVDYETLMAKADIPSTFNTIELVFMVDDTLVRQINCSYGDSIDASEIPDVPFREGFHGEWSRTDYSNIVADETIEAVYSRINTLLSSEQTRESGKPVILVSGDFAENDALQVAGDANNSDDKQTWSVSIPDDGQATHEIRYLPISEDPESVVIYVVTDGHKQRVDTSEMGKYITFDADGNEVTFIAQKESASGQIGHYVALGGAAAAVLAALAAGHAGLSRARKKKRAEERQRSRQKNRKNRDFIDE